MAQHNLTNFCLLEKPTMLAKVLSVLGAQNPLPPCRHSYLGSKRQALTAMSGAAPDAEPGREGFTCSALLMCLYLPGLLSKKKPEEAISTSPPPTAHAAPAPDQPAEHIQETPPHAPSRRAASLDKSECASLCSRSNIVFDFVAEEWDQGQASAQAILHGYCPSPCFDLPVELIRAGERFGAVAAVSEPTKPVPVTAAFVSVDDGQRGATLKKVASCLAPGVDDGRSEPRPPRLARFLSASGRRSSVPRPLVMPSRAAPPGQAVGGDCELGGSAVVPACNAMQYNERRQPVGTASCD
ncbi:hypothetical protein ZEAMMB73_Zm00001d012580 [Zea mays]|uniref:Uncharacterized protein n=2 Tax=Zea mays TaxID=4577 RepID=A0A1D6G9X3_MAIZE|nr:hypothetical protein ZEAMMB73_Zm00001d012580 [Zea mays]